MFCGGLDKTGKQNNKGGVSIKSIIWAEPRCWMDSTLDLSLMKAAGTFSLPSLLSHCQTNLLAPTLCASQQKGHCLLMPVSWKWVTAPHHVADLYSDGCPLLGNGRTWFSLLVWHSTALSWKRFLRDRWEWANVYTE